MHAHGDGQIDISRGVFGIMIFLIKFQFTAPPPVPAPSTPPLPSGVNPIHVWAGMRTELIWIYEGAVHPENRNRKSDNDHGYRVWFLLNGSVEVRRDRQVLRGEAGDCIVPPLGPIQQRFSNDARILSVFFSCNWPTGEPLFNEHRGLVLKIAESPSLLGKARELLDLVKTFSPIPTDVHFSEPPVPFVGFLHLQRLFIEWLEVFAQTLVAHDYTYIQVEPIDKRLLHAIRCLKQTSLGAPFPAELIQQESSLGRSQLDRLFFQTFGMTTRSYWNRRKLESAKALLATTASPIKELGFRLGFKQSSHFTTWFHTHTGLNPAAYRARESVADSQEKSRRGAAK